MKKILVKAMAIALAMIMSVGAVYAWYVINYVGKASVGGVTPATPTILSMQIADQSVGAYSANLSLNSTKALSPCTRTKAGTYADEEGTDVTGKSDYVFTKSLYIKCGEDATTSTLKVSNISLTGDGANDEINKALRIAVIKGGVVAIYKGIGENDYTQTFSGISGNDKVVTIIVWYEGTDANCTSANALASNGSVQINISFESE